MALTEISLRLSVRESGDVSTVGHLCSFTNFLVFAPVFETSGRTDPQRVKALQVKIRTIRCKNLKKVTPFSHLP